MVMGDFNAVLSSVDKIGGKAVASSSRGGFRKVVNDNSLIDLGFDGHPFTWNNKRGGLDNIQERLDRVMANAEWKIRFPNASRSHLPAVQYDHKPLLIYIRSNNGILPRPFKFESMWTTHAEAAFVIQEAWNRNPSFASRLKNTKLALKEWNKTAFGNVQTKIKSLTDSIKNI